MTTGIKGGYGILAAGAAALVLHAGAAFGAPTPEQKCEGAKNDAAGKYAACIGKAEKSLLATGDAARYATAIAKCESKQASSWGNAETAAINAGTFCPSQGDSLDIQSFVAACAGAVADAVSGNPLIQDPVSCNADVQTCTSDLGDCTSDLGDCTSDLGVCEADLAACTDNLGEPLKKTGQTTCYHDTSGAVISCAGTGQDAASQAGATHSYTDNGDGTITDNLTNLMWEKLSDNGSIHDKDTSYAGITAAYGKISTLNSMAFAGYTDWRLPNLRELGSLPDYGRDSPAIHPVFHTGCIAGCNGVTCSCTRNDVYTTSTTYRLFPEASWSYNFTDGDMYANYKTDPPRSVLETGRDPAARRVPFFWTFGDAWGTRSTATSLVHQHSPGNVVDSGCCWSGGCSCSRTFPGECRECRPHSIRTDQSGMFGSTIFASCSSDSCQPV